MRKEKNLSKKKNPKPFTKLLRLLDKENHVSRHGELLHQQWEEKGEKILWSTFLSCSGLSVCACVIFSRIFSCRKYPWEVTNTILEGLWVGAQKGAASDGANQSNKAHGHFSPWRQKRREITRAVSKNSLGIDPLSRWVLWQIPIVGTLQPLPVRS